MEEQIVNYLEELIRDEYPDCFMIDIDFDGSRKLQLFIDGDEGIRFDQCQAISRKLEALIDMERLLPENYILEVSSPGVDRPLKLARQYKKHIGRDLTLTLAEEHYTARLLSVGQNAILIAHQDKELEIPFNEIKEAVVKISFK